jgi:hypothetical protein
MVAEALTLVGLNLPQSREGSRSQEDLDWTRWSGKKKASIDPLVLGFSARPIQVLLAP